MLIQISKSKAVLKSVEFLSLILGLESGSELSDGFYEILSEANLVCVRLDQEIHNCNQVLRRCLEENELGQSPISIFSS